MFQLISVVTRNETILSVFKENELSIFDLHKIYANMSSKIPGLRNMHKHLLQHDIEAQINENKLTINGNYKHLRFSLYFHSKTKNSKGREQVVLKVFKKGRIIPLIFFPQDNSDFISVITTLQ